MSIGEIAASRCAACRVAKDAGYVDAGGWFTADDGERHNHLQPDWWHGGSRNALTRAGREAVLDATAAQCEAAADLARGFGGDPADHLNEIMRGRRTGT